MSLWYSQPSPRLTVFSFTTMSLASSDQPGMLGSFNDTVVFSTNTPMGLVNVSAVRMLLADPVTGLQHRAWHWDCLLACTCTTCHSAGRFFTVTTEWHWSVHGGGGGW
jgi:hypothetical protein